MRNGFSARWLLFAFAMASFAISIVSAVVLAADAWLNRTPDSLCDLRATELDVAALQIDTTVAAGATGAWEWWPTGLTCRYVQVGGGSVVVQPGPLLSVVLMLFILGFVAALTLLIVRSVANSHEGGLRNPTARGYDQP